MAERVALLRALNFSSTLEDDGEVTIGADDGKPCAAAGRLAEDGGAGCIASDCRSPDDDAGLPAAVTPAFAVHT